MVQITPLHIGVQWAWARLPDIVFSKSAFAPNMGGNQRIEITDPVIIRGIAWQSSVKTGAHEILMHFMVSPFGNGLGEEGEINLLSTHHIGNTPTMVIKSVQFGKDEGIYVPAGRVVWVYGEGNGPTHPAPVEIQSTLYTIPA
jgi:hypothetical protein